MKYGIREICDVVLKAKANQKLGNKIFYKGEPVLYFDTLKTSTMEGAATTVYAQGGRGNSRLVAWEGERTVTFTMEDALISPIGFSILSGAGLVEAGTDDVTVKVHTTEVTENVVYTAAKKEEDGTTTPATVEIYVTQKPYVDGKENSTYIMLLDNGEVVSEPYIPNGTIELIPEEIEVDKEGGTAGEKVKVPNPSQYAGMYKINLKTTDDLSKFATNSTVLVDFYVEKTTGAQQIEITPDKFGGNYYLEASTLFRTTDGVDVPAEFIIPNCKIQSNFTFTMASSGDPSTFTFTMDAFPDYLRFDNSKKVLAAIQIMSASTDDEATRDETPSKDKFDVVTGKIIETTTRA